MALAAFLDRKRTHFLLWRPGSNLPAPKLVIGKFNAGPPVKLDSAQTFAMVASPLNGGLPSTDLWEIDAATCGLTNGQVYHYWFETISTNPYGGGNITLR